MRHGERCRPTVRGDPTPVEVGTGVIRVQVAQGDHPQQPGPSRVRAPSGGRGKPAREHGDRRGGQARQKPVAHPLVEMGEDLVGVEKEDQPLVGRQGDGIITVRHVHDDPGGIQHAVGAGHLPTVETHDVRAGVAGRGGVLVEERTLAHPAGTVHEQNAEVGVLRLERRREDVQLGRPADEVPPSPSRQHPAECLSRGVDPPGHVVHRVSLRRARDPSATAQRPFRPGVSARLRPRRGGPG